MAMRPPPRSRSDLRLRPPPSAASAHLPNKPDLQNHGWYFAHADGSVRGCNGAINRSMNAAPSPKEGNRLELMVKRIQALNRKLQQTTFDGVSYLWLAGLTSYSDAPQQRSDNRVNEGTYGPINNFNSPFAGQTIEQVGDWIKNAPEEVDLDRRFFAVLDQHSSDDDTVQLCRIGDGESEGSRGKVQWFPVEPKGETFGYIQTGMFDSDLQGYRFKQQRAGRPDRSSG